MNIEIETGPHRIVEGIYLGSAEEARISTKYNPSLFTGIDCRNVISRLNSPCDNLEAAKVLAKRIHKARESGSKVIVYCDGGVERSPLVVAVYLKEYHNMTIDDAYDLIASKRKCIARRPFWLPDNYIR